MSIHEDAAASDLSDYDHVEQLANCDTHILAVIKPRSEEGTLNINALAPLDDVFTTQRDAENEEGELQNLIRPVALPQIDHDPNAEEPNNFDRSPTDDLIMPSLHPRSCVERAESLASYSESESSWIENPHAMHHDLYSCKSLHLTPNKKVKNEDDEIKVPDKNETLDGSHHALIPEDCLISDELARINADQALPCSRTPNFATLYNISITLCLLGYVAHNHLDILSSFFIDVDVNPPMNVTVFPDPPLATLEAETPSMGAFQMPMFWVLSVLVTSLCVRRLEILVKVLIGRVLKTRKSVSQALKLFHQGQYLAAEREFEVCINTVTDTYQQTQLRKYQAICMVTLGEVNGNQAQLKMGLDILDNISSNPKIDIHTRVVVYAQYLQAVTKSGEYQLGLSILQNALELIADHPDLCSDESYSLILECGAQCAAHCSDKPIIKVEPAEHKSLEAKLRLGRRLAGSGSDLKTSKKLLLNALKARNDIPEAHIILTTMFYKEHNFLQTASHLRSAIACFNHGFTDASADSLSLPLTTAPFYIYLLFCLAQSGSSEILSETLIQAQATFPNHSTFSSLTNLKTPPITFATIQKTAEEIKTVLEEETNYALSEMFGHINVEHRVREMAHLLEEVTKAGNSENVPAPAEAKKETKVEPKRRKQLDPLDTPNTPSVKRRTKSKAKAEVQTTEPRRSPRFKD